MENLEGNIQINDNQKDSIIIEDLPNKKKNKDANLIIPINDSINQNENNNNQNFVETPKKENNNNNNNNNNINDETNYPISESNKKGLFSQFESPNIEINPNYSDSKMTLDEPVL